MSTAAITVTVKLINGDLIEIHDPNNQYKKRDIAMLVAHECKQDHESVQLTLLEENYYLASFKDPRITLSVRPSFEYVNLLNHEDDSQYYDADCSIYDIKFLQYGITYVSNQIIIKEDNNRLYFALSDSFDEVEHYHPVGGSIYCYNETDKTVWFSSPIDCLYNIYNIDNTHQKLMHLYNEMFHRILMTRIFHIHNDIFRTDYLDPF